MASVGTRGELRLEVISFFKTVPGGGLPPLTAGVLTFPPFCLASSTHYIHSLSPASLSSLRLSISLPLGLSGPTTAWRGRGRGGEGRGSAATPGRMPGLCPWSAPSADWPGAPARMGRAQGLDSSRSSSQPNPLLREALWDLSSGFEGGILVGCHRRSCGGGGSYLHT